MKVYKCSKNPLSGNWQVFYAESSGYRYLREVSGKLGKTEALEAFEKWYRVKDIRKICAYISKCKSRLSRVV